MTKTTKAMSHLAIVLSAVLSSAAFADVPNAPHLTTTGYGEVITKPDMAEFSVQVIETAMTAEQAKQSVDKVVESYLQSLADLNVNKENISSSNLYLTPQYHYPDKGKPELIGYQASRNITVTVDDIANLNRYLDLALSHGINQVDKIQLKVRDEAKYQAQARQAAIDDAVNKATALAKGFGQHLDGVWSINYNSSNTQPVLMRSMSASAQFKAADSYQDSTLVIRDRVDVSYKLK